MRTPRHFLRRSQGRDGQDTVETVRAVVSWALASDTGCRRTGKGVYEVKYAWKPLEFRG